MSTFSSAVKDSLYNLGVDISLLPTMIDIEIRSKLMNRSSKKKSKNKCDSAKSEPVNETSTSTDNSVQEESKQSEEKIEPVYFISKGENAPIDIGEETSKWLYYTIGYISDKNQKLVEDLTEDQKEFVNGIASYFKFGKVYKDSGISDIECYDRKFKEKYKEDSKFDISIDCDILPLLGNEEFLNRVEEKKKLLKEQCSKENKNKDEKDLNIIHPISFETLKNPDSVVTFDSKNKAEKLPHKLFKRLENIFVPIIGKKNHRYEKNGDLVNLHVYKDGTESTFVLDPGVCMGCGKVFILANTSNDKLFVSTEHKDLLRKILSDKSYTISIEDIRKITHDYFSDMIVYRYIDMNNTPYIGKLSSEDFIKLGNKLMFVINQEKAVNQSDKDLPRLRFNSWESVDKFSLISDKIVKSPLSSTGETSSEILDGLKINVEGNILTRTLCDSKCTIEMK